MDPRDKLFAVFGLVSCADADGIVACYTKSTEEYGIQARNGNHQRDVPPWAFARLDIDSDGGNKSCGQYTFDFDEPRRYSRYLDLQVYLIREPDEYKDYSFEEAGSVSVHVDASSCMWDHDGCAGRKSIRRFNKYALCGRDRGYGDVRAEGLLHMDGLAHEGVWKSGPFEAIDLVGEDTAPYPGLGASRQLEFFHRQSA
ncbi:uncharacterized protein LY79DRAFT_580167 [Colletotrichum navitas]|uniref:Uncharacterized protein n=1 Tax=Colletotrichum navitas TaxID=681940 RepID=A0AAD8PZ49_9PEZI|nr:uncharacterized protein LY79DRAFT_580167 [Colletotrichum navitas]KAK1590230.1 hypothetical protein LY79DRAFT_580167 [Colletotrichum navitas]